MYLWNIRKTYEVKCFRGKYFLKPSKKEIVGIFLKKEKKEKESYIDPIENPVPKIKRS